MPVVSKYDSICVRCDLDHNNEVELNKTTIVKQYCYECHSYRYKIKNSCSECGYSFVEEKRCCCQEEY